MIKIRVKISIEKLLSTTMVNFTHHLITQKILRQFCLSLAILFFIPNFIVAKSTKQVNQNYFIIDKRLVNAKQAKPITKILLRLSKNSQKSIRVIQSYTPYKDAMKLGNKKLNVQIAIATSESLPVTIIDKKSKLEYIQSLTKKLHQLNQAIGTRFILVKYKDLSDNKVDETFKDMHHLIEVVSPLRVKKIMKHFMLPPIKVKEVNRDLDSAEITIATGKDYKCYGQTTKKKVNQYFKNRNYGLTIQGDRETSSYLPSGMYLCLSGNGHHLVVIKQKKPILLSDKQSLHLRLARDGKIMVDELKLTAPQKISNISFCIYANQYSGVLPSLFTANTKWSLSNDRLCMTNFKKEREKLSIGPNGYILSLAHKGSETSYLGGELRALRNAEVLLRIRFNLVRPLTLKNFLGYFSKHWFTLLFILLVLVAIMITVFIIRNQKRAKVKSGPAHRFFHIVDAQESVTIKATKNPFRVRLPQFLDTLTITNQVDRIKVRRKDEETTYNDVKASLYINDGWLLELKIESFEDEDYPKLNITLNRSI